MIDVIAEPHDVAAEHFRVEVRGQVIGHVLRLTPRGWWLLRDPQGFALPAIGDSEFATVGDAVGRLLSARGAWPLVLRRQP